MQSKNVISADNQQERLKIVSWIVGFTDGEGCFSVSLLKNKTSKTGWQVFPEFVITQGKKSLQALKVFKKYFQCGNIYENKRSDNHNENLCRYCVRSIVDLQTKIIPFFQKNQLLTSKRNDFRIFCEVFKLILKKEHLNNIGIAKIAKLIQKMNRKKLSRF